MAVSLTVEEGKSLMRQFCNFQERCHQDVRTKGLKLGFRGEALEEIISEMISEGLLDEERYARSLARGKFRMNEWGRIKIKQALKMRSIPEYCINKAMNEINEDEYLDTMKKLIEVKKSLMDYIDTPANKKKLVDYMLQKGYELNLVLSILNVQ